MEFYHNPIKHNGDFADPFVLRFNGEYYLYCTNPDVRCWKSKDLIHWHLEGPTVQPDEFPELVPFAPEVIYWNGKFYMYTSPHGLGHFVLEADRPTGPFHKISGNLGHNIDGSVFIDDDGKWYFYYAHDNGIQVSPMTSPIDLGPSQNTGAFLHGWTEGPTVIKQNGLYYMTYTGNHYLSKGYRIQAAISSSPLGPFMDCPYNPILLQTEGSQVGLGHNSIVTGLDLQTRYIVYHNLNPDKSRDLNVDVLKLTDRDVSVSGPSTGPQPIPHNAEWIGDKSRFTLLHGSWETDGEFVVSKSAPFCCIAKAGMQAPGVLEWNLVAESDRYGVLLGEYRLLLDKDKGKIIFEDKNRNVITSAVLPADYRHDVLHRINMELNEDLAVIYLDGLKKIEISCPLQYPIAPGYFSESGILRMGYTALCRKYEPDLCMYHPIPFEMPLDRPDIRVSVPQAGRYHLAVLASSVTEPDACMTVTIGHQAQRRQPFTTTYDMAAYHLDLQPGLQCISVQFGPGIHDPKRIFLYPAPEQDQKAEIIITEGTGKKLTPLPSESYTAVRFELPEGPELPEILFRASQLALGGEGTDEDLGYPFFLGYSIAIKESSLILSKHRYDTTQIATTVFEAALQKSRRWIIKLNLNEFLIQSEEQPNFRICFRDPEPILWGNWGLRWQHYSCGGIAAVSSIQGKAYENDTTK